MNPLMCASSEKTPSRTRRIEQTLARYVAGQVSVLLPGADFRRKWHLCLPPEQEVQLLGRQPQPVLSDDFTFTHHCSCTVFRSLTNMTELPFRYKKVLSKRERPGINRK